jgi:hypothetical protein
VTESEEIVLEAFAAVDTRDDEHLKRISHPEASFVRLFAQKGYAFRSSLAERMMEREKLSPPVPSYIAHRGWREPRRHLARHGSSGSDPR